MGINSKILAGGLVALAIIVTAVGAFTASAVEFTSKGQCEKYGGTWIVEGKGNNKVEKCEGASINVEDLNLTNKGQCEKFGGTWVSEQGNEGVCNMPVVENEDINDQKETKVVETPKPVKPAKTAVY
ncbi:MAG: hypothetical protein LBQ11_01425 [Candidatus Nomurabacteria bacterium]|jgi:hypothetical protein|nr:hypothetical protein [Candidatus Nomurabacteria bacterium]